MTVKLPATWALVGVLLAAHVAIGWWGLDHREVADPWTAYLGTRPDRLRILGGGQYLPLVRGGAWWRLVTSGFVHASGTHLLTNVASLGALGALLEPRLGAWRWLGVCVLGMLVGSVLAQLSGIPQSDGASAGVYALLGAGIVAETRWQEPGRAPPPLARWLAGFAAVNLLISFAVPGLDGAAHTGGLITGALVGRWARPDAVVRGWVAVVVAAAVVASLGWSGVLGR